MTRYRLRETTAPDFALVHDANDDSANLRLMDHVRYEDCRCALTAVSPEGLVVGVAWIADRQDPMTGPDGPELHVMKAARGAAPVLADRVLARARDAGMKTVFGDSQILPREVQQRLVHHWDATHWPPDSDFWQVNLNRA